MAVLSHSGPCMRALTSPVTYAWPARIEEGGCSLCASSGTTQATEGSVPARVARLAYRLHVLDLVATRGRVGVATARRPAGDQKQVGRQTPGSIGLEQVVLEHEGTGVGPVIGDLAGIVIAQYVCQALRPLAR